MGCVKLLRELDLTCQDRYFKYFQSAVLMNRSDVDEKIVSVDENRHRVNFNLKAGASGKLFRGNETVSQINGMFSKSERKGVPMYSHSVDFPVAGVDEDISILIKELDRSDVFAALQFRNNTIVIFGFENGLKTGDYDYEPQSEIGGAVFSMESRYAEYYPPLIYSAGGNEIANFDNKFQDIGAVLQGDFNDDFNNDFYI